MSIALIGVVPDKCFELPGYFRLTKKWDILVVRDGQPIAAIEAKSHVRPWLGYLLFHRWSQ